MALDIQVGSLPEDGTRFNPEEALTAFVNGTRLSNFDSSHFAGGAVDFVFSATEPPAVVTRATSWFKRGEGTLYHALFFTPQEGPHSGATQWCWVAASGSRKEILVEYRFPVRRPGGVLRQTGENHPGIYGVQRMAHRFLVPRVLQSQFTSHTSVSLQSDTTASWLGFWSEHSTDPIFVALDTTVTDMIADRLIAPSLQCGWSGHDYHVAVECGFCDLYVGTGYTGAPSRLVLFEGLNDDAFQVPTGSTFKVGDVEVGYGLTSGHSGAGTVLGFLRPSITHRNV